MALDVTEPKPEQPKTPDWGRMISRILAESARAARTEKLEPVGYFCEKAGIQTAKDAPLTVNFESNLVPPTKAEPAVRKDPQYPCYRMSLSVRPIGPVGQLTMTETDQAITWDGTSSTRGYTVKRLGVEIVVTVLSDDAKFVKTLNAILDQEISRTLKESAAKPAPPATQGEDAELTRIRLNMQRELGPDWKITTTRKMNDGDPGVGMHLFGVNEALKFDPPGPKGERFAVLQIYLHPLSVKDLPAFTQSDGSMLSTHPLGSTSTHRIFGGLHLPPQADREKLEKALRLAIEGSGPADPAANPAAPATQPAADPRAELDAAAELLRKAGIGEWKITDEGRDVGLALRAKDSRHDGLVVLPFPHQGPGVARFRRWRGQFADVFVAVGTSDRWTLAGGPNVNMAKVEVVRALNLTPLVETEFIWGEPVDGLQTRLTLDRREAAIGERVYAYLDVRNGSGKPVELAFVNHLGRFLRVRRPDGADVPIIDKSEASVLDKPYTLAPGSQDQVFCDRLDLTFDLRKPGEYTIQWVDVPAKFAPQGKVPPPSNVVHLKIVAAGPAATQPAWRGGSEWSKGSGPLQTRLAIPDGTRFAAGKPIPIRVELRNVGDKPVSYVGATPYCRGSMTVTDRTGKQLPFLAGWASTGPYSPVIKPGEQAVLADEFNLAENFYLRKVGPYTVRYEGAPSFGDEKKWVIPASPPLTIEVVDNETAQADGDPVGKLLPALPGDWSLWGGTAIGTGLHHPGSQWGRVRGGYVQLIHKDYQPKGPDGPTGVMPITVWIMQERATEESWDPGKLPLFQECRPTLYLGGNRFYHVYLHVPESAAQAWPTAAKDIAKTLEVSPAPPATQPAAAVGWSEPVNGLRWRAWSSSGKVEVGGKVEVNIEFQNVSDQPLRLFKDVTEEKSVYPTVFTADGKKDVLSIEHPHESNTREDETVLVTPKGTYRAKWQWRAPQVLGATKLWFYYDAPINTNPQVNGFWTGLLPGLTLEFTIVAPGQNLPATQPDAEGWGKAVNGLQSRIVLDKRTLTPGEPVSATIEVRNVSDKPIRYDGRGEGRFDLAYLDGSDEKSPPQPDVSVQTTFSSEMLHPDSGGRAGPKKPYEFPTLEPGKTMTVGKKGVVWIGGSFSGQCVLVPGGYRLAWSGNHVGPAEELVSTKPSSRLPPLFDIDEEYMKWYDEATKRAQKIAVGLPPAAVEFQVVASPDLGAGRAALGRLQRVMPLGWCIEGISLPAEGIQGNLWGRLSGFANPAMAVCFVHRPAPGLLSENMAFFEVYVAADRVSADVEKAKGLTYLGRCPLGHVYLRGDRGGRWNHAASDIAAALEVTENQPKRPAGLDWGRATCRVLWAVHRQGADLERAEEFLRHINFAPQPNELARIEYESNLVPPTKVEPAARKDPQCPYYRVSLSVRPIGPVGQLDMTEADQAIKWDGTSSTRGYTVKRLGVEIVVTVLSDDAKFVKTLNAILDQEISRTLKESAPPATQPAAGLRGEFEDFADFLQHFQARIRQDWRVEWLVRRDIDPMRWKSGQCFWIKLNNPTLWPKTTPETRPDAHIAIMSTGYEGVLPQL